MKYWKYLLITLILLASFGFASAQDTIDSNSSSVNAVSPVFPIAELNNCASKEECRDFCAVLENREVCRKFAESRQLVRPKMMNKAELIGPGGCVGVEVCRLYCEQTSNLEECTKFGLEKGLINRRQAEQSRLFIKKMDGLDCETREACVQMFRQRLLEEVKMKGTRVRQPMMRQEVKPLLRPGLPNYQPPAPEAWLSGPDMMANSWNAMRSLLGL